MRDVPPLVDYTPGMVLAYSGPDLSGQVAEILPIPNGLPKKWIPPTPEVIVEPPQETVIPPGPLWGGFPPPVIKLDVQGNPISISPIYYR
jgi:hypothetical protein